jgi:sulfoquinovosidase
MGLQPTEWNFKGKQVPLIVDEGGVGRGLQPLTREMNLGGGGGGTTMTSYGPAVSYVTNNGRAFMFENNQIGIANFNSNSTEILYWHAKAIEGFVFSGDNFLEQAQNLSLKIGTM